MEELWWEGLNDIATTLYQQSEDAELESLYERVLKIRENALGIDHHNVVVILENMAEFYEEIEKKKRL